MSKDAPADAPSSTGKPGARVRVFLDLIKFGHSIFAMPFALVATALGVRELAHSGSGPLGLGDYALLVGLVVVCMVGARTFAMTVNRLVDRRFDRENPRTARRPSVTGAISPAFMIGVIVFSAAIFVVGAGMFYVWFGNRWPLILAVPVLAWLGFYSFTKRFTFLCHLVLGVSLGLAPLSAWMALVPPRGPVMTWPIVCLGAAVVFWVGGFDILYALQDEGIDRQAKLHSIPARFGRLGALWVSRGCHVLTIAALGAVGVTGGFHWLYWVAFGLATALLVVEQALVRPDDISKVNVAFMTVNGLVGVSFATLAIVDLAWIR